MTTINDLVLIYMEGKPLAFARVEDIQPDIKQGWFQITLLVLQIPPTLVTWILRDSYINGEEYTMGGKKMRIEKVVVPQTTQTSGDKKPVQEKSDESDPKKTGGSTPKVISLADLKKNPR